MGLRINTNIQSLAAQRNLGKVEAKKNQSLERLSSGQRINRAGDDAAGLAISDKLKANIRGTQQAARNAGDGISLIQTAEGGMNEISDILVRLRELSVQSASDTVGDTERGFSDLEFQSLVDEVNRISSATQFNGKYLLTGSGETFDFQIGIKNDGKLDRLSYDSSKTNATGEALGIDSLTVATKVDSQENLDKIDSAINMVNSNRARLGAMQNRLSSTINNLQTQTENLAAANSRIRDTDIAVESAELTKGNILSASGVSVLAQANNAKQSALKLIG